MKLGFGAAWMVLLCGCIELGGGSPNNSVPIVGGDEDVVCEAELSLSGTLTAAATPEDCIPLGTWTVNVTVSDEGNCGTVDVEGTYVYEVTGTAEDGYVYTYPADPDNDKLNLKVSSVGSSCQGDFKHYSADGKTLILLKPFEETESLSGMGYYSVSSVPQI